VFTLPQAYAAGQPSFTLQYFDGCRVSGMLVHLDDPWNGMRRRAEHLRKEAFRGGFVAFGREQKI